MKNLKSLITAFILTFTVLISNANVCYEETQASINGDTITPMNLKANFEFEKEPCALNASVADADIAMLEAYTILNEEEDAIFDFNTEDYLPADFTAYNEDELILTEYELLKTEDDEPFDFDTSLYLPVNLHASM